MESIQHFHATHGINVHRSSDGLRARRLSGYGAGFVFTSKPVKVGEIVRIRLCEMGRTGGLCFGFTAEDPRTLREHLGNSYLELNMRKNSWIWPLFKDYCLQDMVLFYYVSDEGEVHFGIDDVEKSLFYKKVNITKKLWAVLDLYGEDTTVEYLTRPLDHDVDLIDLEDSTDEDLPNINSGILMCTVCFETIVDSVLYKCGHMCMCYRCAMKQWKGKGDGRCPICRTAILDVVRTYKCS